MENNQTHLIFKATPSLIAHSDSVEPSVISDAETESTSSADLDHMSKQELIALKMMAEIPARALLKEVKLLAEVAADLTSATCQILWRAEQVKSKYLTSIPLSISGIRDRLSALEASFNNDETPPSSPTSRSMLDLPAAASRNGPTRNISSAEAIGFRSAPQDTFGGPDIEESPW